ncbi:MAG TPA: Fis family transcriptional regulator [Blastocatellia bacterium]|jgi:antitoxin HicB|nr:Fis family transcriptional regulator [Blastocatellia bacterium]
MRKFGWATISPLKRKKHIGSSFEDFLKEQGIFEETTTQAVKRVLAWQVSETMKEKGISKIEMAKRMRTSRSQVDRFLDPNNDKVLLETVQRAASVIGKRVSLSLEE